MHLVTSLAYRFKQGRFDRIGVEFLDHMHMNAHDLRLPALGPGALEFNW